MCAVEYASLCRQHLWGEPWRFHSGHVWVQCCDKCGLWSWKGRLFISYVEAQEAAGVKFEYKEEIAYAWAISWDDD